MIDPQGIVGRRVGHLVVTGYAGCFIEPYGRTSKIRHLYHVRCDCGTCKVVRRDQLTSEIVHSCGCSRLGNQNRWGKKK